LSSHKHYWPHIAIAICTLIWGSTWLAIKIGLEDLPPFLFAGIRFVIASVLLLALMFFQRIRFPRDRHSWHVMLFLGFFQMLDYAFVFWGEQYIDSGIGAIIFATMPFFVIILGYLWLAEHKITGVKIFGTVVSFAGVTVVFLRDIHHIGTSWMGDVSIILAALCGAVISVYAKKHADGIHPVVNVTVQMVICAVCLLAAGLLTEDTSRLHWTPQSVASIFYLGVFGSAVAFVVYMWVIKKVSVVEAAIIPVATPLVAVILGWLVRGEALTVRAMIGCVLILIGVYFVNVYRSRARTAVQTIVEDHN